MNIRYGIKTAVTGLKTNKSRSALTILGIVIGITSIMLVMALGQGAQNLILGQIQSIGSKTISVEPGKTPEGMMDAMSMMTDSLKAGDLAVIKNKANVPHAARIMPIVYGTETITYESEAYKPMIFGATDFFADIYDADVKKGRLFNDDEVKSYADVVVIGSTIEEELFGENGDALNQRVKIKGRNFRVVGVLAKKGQSAMVNFDKAAIIPYTTAQQYIFGIKYFNAIVVEADSEENMDATVADLTAAIRNSHDIEPGEDDDFRVETQAQAMEMVGTVMGVLTLFLAAVAAISLLVGGVGIMNIMLVSVTERTREIGLRKSLGATQKDILLQFLAEAIILTASGGAIGIILGGALSFLASVILTNFAGLDWPFSFPISAMMLGIGVSGFIGLTFGFFPARQAAKKSPMEALRYE